MAVKKDSKTVRPGRFSRDISDTRRTAFRPSCSDAATDPEVPALGVAVALLFIIIVGLTGIGPKNANAFIVTVREVGSATLNQSETVNIAPGGEIVTVEVVVDTEGLPFGGYSYGVSITPGVAAGITHTQASLPPLIPLGVGTINEAAGMISGIAQASFFGGLPPGLYVIDTFEFLADPATAGSATISPGFESASDSFLTEGQTCPGSQPNCTVTFHSMQLLSPSNVPMLSPFGMGLLITLLGAASIWALGPFRRLGGPEGSMKRHLPLFLLLSSLCLGSVAAPSSVWAETPNPEAAAVKESLDASSPTLADKWGIEFVALRLSAQNRFLDFRYRVVNKGKAQRLFGPKINPVMLDSQTGHILKVPVPPKLGPMKGTRGAPLEGRTYFVFFANPGGLVEPGHKVKVDFGELEIFGLTVQ
jgi:hypothetical protein